MLSLWLIEKDFGVVDYLLSDEGDNAAKDSGKFTTFYILMLTIFEKKGKKII